MVPVRRWSVWWMVALVVSFLVAVSGLPEVTRSVPVAQAAIELTEASPVVANPLPVFGSRYVAPAPSGAPPALPPNPTLLRAGDGGGAAPTNHGFETPGFTAATPVNHDFALQASVVGEPSNPGFESGDFTDWDVAGSPSIAGDASGGSAALLTSSSDRVTSSVVPLPSDVGVVTVDVGYVSPTGYSWLNVYALHGSGFVQETKLGQSLCRACAGDWVSASFDASAFAGEEVKFEFRTYLGYDVKVDNVAVLGSVPGWSLSGGAGHDAAGGGFVSLPSGDAVSDSFVLDPDVEVLELDVRKQSTYTTYYRAELLTGPGFSTVVDLGYRYPQSTSWETVGYNVAEWAGEEVQLRIAKVYNAIDIDNAGVQQVVVPDWWFSGSVELVDDGEGGLATETGAAFESASFTVGPEAQQLTFRHKGNGKQFDLFVLSGSDFSTETELVNSFISPSVWETRAVPFADFAGETIKLRFVPTVGFGTAVFDDVGVTERVVDAWVVKSHGFTRGVDSRGEYLESLTGAAELETSALGVHPSRTYTVSYALSGSGSIATVWGYWVEDDGSSRQVLYDTATPGDEVVTKYVRVADTYSDTGHFVIRLTEGARLYSFGSNVGRQLATEPFSRSVGHGIDTTTGALTYAETDVAVSGAAGFGFARSYSSTDPASGSLGTGWRHSFDTEVVVHGDTAFSDASVVFGSGHEEWFVGSAFGFNPADARITSTLTKNQDGSFTYRTKHDDTYEFGVGGRLEALTDRNGRSLVVTYDSSGNLAAVADDAGRALTFTIDGSGRIIEVSDPGGGITLYTYDAVGNLTGVTDPEAATRSYGYEAHLLTSVVDAGGEVEITNSYDTARRVVAQTDAVGETITLAYDAPGFGATEVTDPSETTATFYFDSAYRTEAVVDGENNVVEYLYDADGNLTHVIDPASNQWVFGYSTDFDLESTTDPLGNLTEIDYSPDHLPTAITDALGNTTTMAYDGDGNLTSFTDPLGNSATYGYDTDGNPTSVTDPLGETTTYTYDAAGNRLTETDPLGNTTTWTYNAMGLVTSETDPLGNTTTWFRDLLGRVVTERDPLGNEIGYLWLPTGQLYQRIDQLGRVTQWDYDERGLVVAKTAPDGAVTGYEYDDDRRLTSVTDPGASVTSYGYDDADRVVSIADALGNATTFVYDAAGLLAAEQDPLGRVTSYGYDDSGRLVTVTAPDSAVTTYAYDAAGRHVTTTDPLGNTASFGHDANNRRTTVTDALGNATTNGYDANGQLTTVTDPLGNATTYGYDEAGRRTTVTDALGNATTYGYDANGQLASVTDPLGSSSTRAYDELGRQTTLTDAVGNVTSWGFDAASQLLTTTSPGGAVTTHSYDAAGRMATIVDPLGNATSYGYDAVGRRTSVTDANGNTTATAYDAVGRPVSLTDALGGTVGYSYDDAGQLVSLTDPNGAGRSFSYDVAGRLTATTDPLGATWTQAYDGAGNLSASTDPRGVTATYGYDAAGRQVTQAVPSETVTTAYDAAGRVTSVTDAAGVTGYSYDTVGRVTQVAAPSGTVGYSYDGAGRRTGMSTPQGTVGYSYDAAGRVTSLTDVAGGATAFVFDTDGRWDVVSRPNGVTTDYTYDAAGRVTEMVHAGPGGPIDTFSYGYDPAGNRTSFTSNAGTETYQLDELYRLTEFTATDGTATGYTYDAAGNRLTATDPSGTAAYSYDAAGQLVDVDGQTLTHDAAGNVTGDGVSTFGWDDFGRLESVTTGPDTVSYGYDTDGLVTSVDDGAGVEEWVWDTAAGLPMLAAVDDTALLSAGPTTLSETTSGVTSQLLADGVGSLRYVTDPAGAVSGTASFDPFGEATSSGTESLLGFTGEPTLSSGDVYLRARVYDPGTGRFLSRDTVQPNAPGTQGFNVYAYVANNPTTWTDPTGHTAATWSAAGLALALAPILLLLTQHAAAGNTIAGFAAVAGTTTIGAPALALLGLTLGALAFLCFNDGPCGDYLLELLGALGAAGGGVLDRVRPIVEIGHDPTPGSPRPVRPTIWQVISVGAGMLLGGRLLGGDTDQRPPDGARLFHYTSERGRLGILACECIRAASGSTNARHGDGVYFTDVSPEQARGRRPGQLSYALFKVPWNGGKVTDYVSVDAGKLPVAVHQVSPVYGSTFTGSIYLARGRGALPIAGALVDSGFVTY